MTSNSPHAADCAIVWRLAENGGRVLDSGRAERHTSAGSSREVVPLDFSSLVDAGNRNNVYLA